MIIYSIYLLVFFCIVFFVEAMIFREDILKDENEVQK